SGGRRISDTADAQWSIHQCADRSHGYIARESDAGAIVGSDVALAGRNECAFYAVAELHLRSPARQVERGVDLCRRWLVVEGGHLRPLRTIHEHMKRTLTSRRSGGWSVCQRRLLQRELLIGGRSRTAAQQLGDR